MKEKWSGERLESNIYRETTFEHLHRYALAIELAKGKNVLDIACGEGYGADILAQHAANVTGVDIDSEVIREARSKYKRANLVFEIGKIEQIPSQTGCFDIVTCFETLEHTLNHDLVIKEIKRVLKPNGILLISTPDKLFYSDKRNYTNPFHLKELYKEDFRRIIMGSFSNTKFFDQQFIIGSLITSGERSREIHYYSGDFNEIKRTSMLESRFQLAVASDQPFETENCSLFVGGTVLKKAMNQLEISVQKSITYKVGNIILWPLKKALRLLIRD